MAAKLDVIALTPDSKRSQFASDTSGGRYFVTLRVGDNIMREHRIYTAYKLRTAAEEQALQKVAKAASWLVWLLLVTVFLLIIYSLSVFLPWSGGPEILVDALGGLVGASLIYFDGYLVSKLVRRHYQSLPSVNGARFLTQAEISENTRSEMDLVWIVLACLSALTLWIGALAVLHHKIPFSWVHKVIGAGCVIILILSGFYLWIRRASD